MEFIMFLPCNFTQSLEIPQSFLADFKESGHQIATLYSASLCKFWHVKVEQHDSKMYFGSGWESFAKSHHLAEGNLLQFRYEGNLVFTVKTFSPSDCNAAYVSEKFTDQFQANYTDRQIPVRVPEMKMKSKICSQKIKYVEPKVRKQVTTQAIKISSPILEIIIKPYHISRCFLRLPKMFSSAYGIDEWNDITLKVSNGNQYNIGLNHRRGRNFLEKSWTKFLRANDLKAGDKCIFKHLSNHTMEVQIIKNENEKSIDQLQKVNTEQQIPNLASDDTMKKPTDCSKEDKHVKLNVRKEVITQTAKNSPILEKIIKPYHISYGSLHLPKMFTSVYGIDEWNYITIKVSNGNQWNVRVAHLQGQHYLSTGWLQFMRANELKVGDKCIFKHLCNHTMQVQIIKSEKYSYELQKFYTEPQIPEHFVSEDTTMKSTSSSNKNKHVKPKISSNNMGLIGEAVKSKRDSAVLEWIIQPSELLGYVDLPKKLCTSAELNELNDITMTDSDGNQWPIHLTTGWEQFVMANNIEAGDKCIFGPILDRTMQVQIVKNSK